MRARRGMSQHSLVAADLAVKAARAAFEEGPWSKFHGSQRRDLMLKLAALIEQHADEFAQQESRDNGANTLSWRVGHASPGKPASVAKAVDVAAAIATIRYYAGWAEKLHGKHIPIAGDFMCYTRHEPVGVVGQIIPWNFPLLMLAWKFGPALATGCTIVMKSSEKTPLTALMVTVPALTSNPSCARRWRS